MDKLIEWLKARLFAYLATKEKFDITKTVDGVVSVYLRRWYLFKSKHFNIMLHNIRRSDDDPDPHDHPWGFVSIILRNGYQDEAYKFVSTCPNPEGYREAKGTVCGWEQRAGEYVVEDEYGHFKPVVHERWGVRSGPVFNKVRPGSIIYRRAQHIHRVIITPGKEAWTLVFTGGEQRPWGFIRRTGWVYWRKYLGAWNHEHV